MAAKSRSIIILALALVLGLVAAILAQRWVQATAASNEEQEGSVVVAARDINFGQRIEQADVATVTWPAESEPTGAFGSPEQVIGMAAIGSIVKGEPILAQRIARPDQGALLATRVSENKRAITVRVDDVVGVAGFLLPGSRVDVLGSRRTEQGRYETHTLLENLKVLAVDQTATPEGEDKPVVVRAVTLEVDPNQAEVLVKATQEGAVQLTLRNPTDESSVSAPVKNTVKPSRPQTQAPARPTVSVVRGTWSGQATTNR